jgi:hypothetical protein
MQYSEQPTPPFNSPYQAHASRADSLLESPYLSSNRNDSASKYQHGLGLYNYHHQVPITMPPSPSPSGSWSGHVSAGASPVMTQALADPWASGAFEHPVTHSPPHWSSAQASPRSSLSSIGMVPMYSHTGSDNSLHGVNHAMNTAKLPSHEWVTDPRYGHNEPGLPSMRHQSLTVAPERLDTTLLGYNSSYGSTQMTRPEPTVAPGFEVPSYDRQSSEGSTRSASSFPATSAHQQRGRKRKQSDTLHARFRCQICSDKTFARQYNWKMHMLTHDTQRARPHVCEYVDCRKAFVRKTDLNRHNTSIHLRSKDWFCHRCPSKFARKDTCQR